MIVFEEYDLISESDSDKPKIEPDAGFVCGIGCENGMVCGLGCGYGVGGVCGTGCAK